MQDDGHSGAAIGGVELLELACLGGLAFDDALGAIIDSDAEKTKLVLFRGSAKDLYGPTGASQEWLDDFITKA